MRRGGHMLGVALALLALSAHAQNFGRFRKNVRRTPPPFFTAFTSNPGTECDGSAIASNEGTSITFVNGATTRYCARIGDGRLVTIGANGPRVNNNGLLVEGSRTNLVIHHAAFDNAAWTKSNVSTPTANTDEDMEGGSTAELLSTTAAGGYYESTAFVPSQTTGTLSFYVRTQAGTQAFAAVLRDTTAGANRTTTCDIATATTSYQRVSCAVSGATGANNHAVRIFPGGLAGEGSIVAWGVQYEVPTGSFVTSLIPTAGGTAITRANDAATFAPGTSIANAGCLAATVTFGSASQFGGSVLSNGTDKMMGTGSATTVQIHDGTNLVQATVSSLTGRTINILNKWGGSTMTVIADGVTASGSFDGAFSSTATMHIGRSAAASGYCNCTIKNIRIGAHPESCN